jgi:hypothetical protein
VANWVTLKKTATPRGWSLWRAKLGQRSLSTRRHPRMLFPARLLQLRPTLRQPGKSPRRGLLRLLLPPPKMSRQGMTPLPTHPLTRLAKKVRARPRRKQRKRPRYARDHWSPQSRLPGPLPTQARAERAGCGACNWDRGWRNCWSPSLQAGLQFWRSFPRTPHHSGGEE